MNDTVKVNLVRALLLVGTLGIGALFYYYSKHPEALDQHANELRRALGLSPKHDVR